MHVHMRVYVCMIGVYSQCRMIKMLQCVCRVCVREIIIPAVNKSEGPELH